MLDVILSWWCHTCRRGGGDGAPSHEDKKKRQAQEQGQNGISERNSHRMIYRNKADGAPAMICDVMMRNAEVHAASRSTSHGPKQT